jgi:hypothetical protein
VGGSGGGYTDSSNTPPTFAENSSNPMTLSRASIANCSKRVLRVSRQLRSEYLTTALRSATAISLCFRDRASSDPPAAESTTRSNEASILISVGKSMFPPKVVLVLLDEGVLLLIDVPSDINIGIIMSRTNVTTGFFRLRAKVSSCDENSL